MIATSNIRIPGPLAKTKIKVNIIDDIYTIDT